MRANDIVVLGGHRWFVACDATCANGIFSTKIDNHAIWLKYYAPVGPGGTLPRTTVRMGDNAIAGEDNIQLRTDGRNWGAVEDTD